MATSVFSQTFNWTVFSTNTVSWVASPTFSVTKATAYIVSKGVTKNRIVGKGYGKQIN